MNKTRNNAIDAVKGICLLHMLLLHITIVYGLTNFSGEGANLYFHIMSFFMIPFFFFSGFFFSMREELKVFIKHKAERLIIPLIFWSLISLPLYYLFNYLVNGNMYLLAPFRLLIKIGSLGSNDALWFLFSLFFVNTIFYLVSYYLKSGKKVFGFIALCFIYALIDRYKLPCYLSSSNISLGLVYFYLGYKVKEISKEREIINVNYFIIAVSVFILINIFDPQYMMIVTLTQPEGSFILNLLFSLCGTYILWFIFYKIQRTPVLSYIGSHSMSYYVWHMIPLRLFVDPVLKAYYPDISYGEYLVFGGGIIIISGWLIDKYANRYCPILLGVIKKS